MALNREFQELTMPRPKGRKDHEDCRRSTQARKIAGLAYRQDDRTPEDQREIDARVLSYAGAVARGEHISFWPRV